MFVLVNYHMDTFFGIGYRSEHIQYTWWVSRYRWICTYRERDGGDIIWGIHGEYPFAGGDVYNLQ
jgi:hypothetical protein